jgi:hypothetical protein
MKLVKYTSNNTNGTFGVLLRKHRSWFYSILDLQFYLGNRTNHFCLVRGKEVPIQSLGLTEPKPCGWADENGIDQARPIAINIVDCR